MVIVDGDLGLREDDGGEGAGDGEEGGFVDHEISRGMMVAGANDVRKLDADRLGASSGSHSMFFESKFDCDLHSEHERIAGWDFLILIAS